MNLCYFKVYCVYVASLNSVKCSRIFAEVELWMTVSKLKTAGFVQSWILEKVLKFAQHFPDRGKVWKIEVKSWKNGKKSWVFLKAAQQVLQKWKFFHVGQILFNLAFMSWKKLCSCVFFKFSIDHLFHNLESGKINYCFGKSLKFWIKNLYEPWKKRKFVALCSRPS